MGNEPSRGTNPRKPESTKNKHAGGRNEDGDLTAEQIAILDPRIREWVLNANYTVVSQFRDGPGGTEGGSGMRGRHSEGVQRAGESSASSSRSRRSADGILIVHTGKEGKERVEPELEQLKKLGMHLPLRFKEEYRGFWPVPPPRGKQKRMEVDPLETYKMLQHYQMRLNASSLQTTQAQDVLYNKIAKIEPVAWSCAHRTACMGVMVNDLETHISEAWNIERQLALTRQRLGKAVQLVEQLLTTVHPDLRAFLEEPPYTIAPQFTHAYYLKLNYLTITPYNIGTTAMLIAEKKWLNNILPYWDVAIGQPFAKSLWRQGIPPRLRAYVWQRAIGNRLFLTREMFHEYRASAAAAQVTAEQSDPIYEAMEREQSSDSESHSADGTVEIDLTDPSNRTTDPIISLARQSSTSSMSNDDKSSDNNPSSTSNGLPPSKHRRTHELIIRDSLRTFSRIGIFRTPKTAPHDDLVAVLHALATLKPELGYVQGQSFLAAVLLLYMPADEAFVALGNLLDQSFFRAFSKFDLDSIREQTEAYEKLLEKALPSLYEHFASINLTPELYLFDWYVTLFAKPLSPLASGIIWDAYLMEGVAFVPLITCSILKQFAPKLLESNFEECMLLLRQIPEDFNIGEAMHDVDTITTQAQVAPPQPPTPLSHAGSPIMQRARPAGEASQSTAPELPLPRESS